MQNLFTLHWTNKGSTLAKCSHDVTNTGTGQTLDHKEKGQRGLLGQLMKGNSRLCLEITQE